MRNLNRICKAVEKDLDKKDRARERAIRAARNIIRSSKKIIQGLHNGDKVAGLMRQAEADVRALKKSLDGHPDLLHSGPVTDALQEHAEAFIFEAVASGKDVPTPQAIGVPPEAYILGLGDVVGELRRLVLSDLKEGDIDGAEQGLYAMETVYDVLMLFNFPTAILPIRHKQDVARGLIERTRGEVTMATRTLILEKHLGKERLERLLREPVADLPRLGTPPPKKGPGRRRRRR